MRMDAAILDPTDKKIMAMAQATETLLGKDAFCDRYLNAYKEGKIVV